jgi:rare lipoprotein A
MFSRYHGQSGTRRLFKRAALCLSVSTATMGFVLAASVAVVTPAGAKTPGKTYCFVGKCHRVMTLEETRRAVGQTRTVFSSHYGPAGQDRFNPSNVTSSGEYYRAGAPDNAASPNLPNGTVVLVRNPATGQSAVLRINNAGPYWGNRTLDVSRAAAQRLGFAGQGVARLQLRVLRAPSPSEASYRRGRRYAAVPGPIGSHGSIEQAVDVASRSVGRSAPSEPAVAPATRATAVAARSRTRTTPRPVTVASADVTSAAPRPSRTTRQRASLTGSGTRAPECQGWVGSCTVSGWTTSSSTGSGPRTRVALSSSNR